MNTYMINLGYTFFLGESIYDFQKIYKGVYDLKKLRNRIKELLRTLHAYIV